MTGSTRRPPARRRAGFTLVEVLIALGIFAIGMIAVASLFPVAALLQQETADEVIAEAAAQSAKAVVDAKQLTFTATPTLAGDLAGYHALAGATKTEAVPLYQISAALLNNYFPPTLRSYPTSQVVGTNISNCDLHWVPFVQDLNGDDTGVTQNWVMRVMLLKADSRATYAAAGNANPNDGTGFPRVVSQTCSVSGKVFTLQNANHGLEAGDIVMDSNGTDHLITDVNGAQLTVLNTITRTPATPSRVWYAPPYGGVGSPAQRVVTITIEPAQP